jgi:hypothetical protein
MSGEGKVMKRSMIRSLLGISLSAMLILGDIGTVFAADDTSEEENYSTQVLEDIEETSENVNVAADEDDGDFTVELLTYEVIGSGEVEVHACDTSAESIDIPKYISYEGYDYYVTRIGEAAFGFCRSLSSVTIPEGITRIGDWAFTGCSNLRSVEIPKGVTSIGRGTFGGCSSLCSVIIPEGVTSIDEKTFFGCNSLSSVEIPEGVTSIGTNAFDSCSSLSGVRIPEGVTYIGESAFDGCSSLSSITIPKGVTSIEPYVFGWCSSLSSVEIPEGVTRIDRSAFYGCSSLSSVNIPEGVTTIGAYVFYDCSSLSSITIPESVTSIGNSAFSDCSKLVIYGKEDSYANTYAIANNIPFNIIQDTGQTSEDYFKLEVDTNQFIHSGLPYIFHNSSYKSQLYKDSLLTWDGTFQLYKYLGMERDENGNPPGVCHGIALSMCYGSQGYIDFDQITSGATNYWSLGNPSLNNSMSDMLVYYQFTQLTSKGTATKTIDKNGWHTTSLSNRLKKFLEDLVNEAKESQEQKRPWC